MRRMIDEFRIRPGDHCGSAAMRGLLHHYSGLDLPEPAVFGLGAGVTTGLIQNPNAEAPGPSFMCFGRQAALELDIGRHLQVDYRERTEDDDDEAWRVVREEVLEGRPTMLVGDIFYLDYRDYTVNFPSHRFVLVGFDDEAEQVFIADRINDTPEVCSLGAVRESRNPKQGTTDQNRWGRFHGTEIGRSLRDAAEAALRTCVHNMNANAITGSEGESQAFAGARLGLAGTKAAAELVPTFADHPNATATAKFNASCLEKFGNGGGNFRRLYAGFLGWARELDPKLVPETAAERMTESADAWTAASSALFRASDTPGDPAPWREAGGHLGRAYEIEAQLFSELADGLG